MGEHKIKESDGYDIVIQQQRLFHYENLLTTEITKIRENYEVKLSNSKIVAYISFLFTVSGFTEDTFIVKLIKSSEYYHVIFNILINLLCLIPFFISIKKIIALNKLRKLINIYHINSESIQNSVFKKFILDEMKINKDLRSRIENIQSDDFISKYYYEDDKEDIIIFYKSKLEFFLENYLKGADDKIPFEIGKYVTEVIISRYLIENKIEKIDEKDKFKFTINKNNVLGFRI